MNDIEICYVAALAEGLRLINEKAKDRGITLTKFNADALIHFVRAKGDRLVEIYALNPSAYTPTENLNPSVAKLQPYIHPKRDPCSIEDCKELVYAKGFCKTHYCRKRLGRNMKRPIRVINRKCAEPLLYVLKCRETKRLQNASSTS